MKSLLTYRPKQPCTNLGGYRYFFNGQEGDNEVFGNVALHAFEYRMHDARLGRFWSIDPLAAKYPWNSTYAFAENSPIGYLEMEGLEKVQFGKYAVNFSNLDEKQVKLYLKKYRDYHHGNIKVKEIMQTDNDNEYWKVSDISDTYMRSIGTRIVKFNMDKTTTLSDNVRMNVGQFITRYGDLEGHHDGSNSGRITREDLMAGFAIVSAMTGIGAMVETGFSILGTLSIMNSIDDIVGIFTNGQESFSQNCFSSNKKGVDIAKTIMSAGSAGKGAIKIKNNVSNGNYFGIMSMTMDMLSTGENVNKTISDEKNKKQP